MKPLFENWQKFITEAKYSTDTGLNIFVADCILRYTLDGQSQSDILTAMRAIEGVTIVTVVEPARTLGNQEVMRIKIKYTPINLAVSEYTANLQRKINKINGVLSLQILKAVRA